MNVDRVPYKTCCVVSNVPPALIPQYRVQQKKQPTARAHRISSFAELGTRSPLFAASRALSIIHVGLPLKSKGYGGLARSRAHEPFGTT